MPVIANGFGAPAVDPSQLGAGNALNSLSSVFTDMGQRQLRQIAVNEAARKAAAEQGLGEIFGAAGAVDPSRDRVAVANGADPDKVAAAHRFGLAMQPGGLTNPVVASLLNAGGNYAGSYGSQTQAQAATSALSAQQAAQQAAAADTARRKAYVDYNMPDGRIVNAPADSQPAGSTKATTTDAVKAGATYKDITGPNADPNATIPTNEAITLGLTSPAGPKNNHVVGIGSTLVGPDGKTLYENKGIIGGGDEKATETIDFLARRVLAGDPSALQNIGRGAQGGALVQAIQARVAELAKEQGIDPKDILASQAGFQGQKSEQRALGSQNARVTSAATEAKGAAQMALDALDALPRSNVVPANRLWQMGESALSDPALKGAQVALMTLKNTYARAINPNGAPHMGDKEHFDQVMSTADGPEATHAAIGQILREVEMAQESPAKAMKILENVRKGKPSLEGVDEGFGTSTAAPTAGPKIGAAQPPPVDTVKTPEDVKALAPGTRFVIPDGSGRIGVAK